MDYILWYYHLRFEIRDYTPEQPKSLFDIARAKITKSIHSGSDIRKLATQISPILLKYITNYEDDNYIIRIRQDHHSFNDEIRVVIFQKYFSYPSTGKERYQKALDAHFLDGERFGKVIQYYQTEIQSIGHYINSIPVGYLTTYHRNGHKASETLYDHHGHVCGTQLYWDEFGHKVSEKNEVMLEFIFGEYFVSYPIVAIEPTPLPIHIEFHPSAYTSGSGFVTGITPIFQQVAESHRDHQDRQNQLRRTQIIPVPKITTISDGLYWLRFWL